MAAGFLEYGLAGLVPLLMAAALGLRGAKRRAEARRLPVRVQTSAARRPR